MKTILIAEDDKFLIKVYETKLKKEKMNVVMAYNGKEAVEKAKEHKPSVILLDLIMPVMNGFEALENLKKDPELKAIPVIILSNLGQENDIKKGKELGAIDFIVKANTPIQEIVNKIQAHL